MNGVITLNRTNEITLDKLWREAELIGSVDVSSYSTTYSVRITFKNGPSSIMAKGEGRDIYTAFINAITEARRLAQ